MDNLGEVWLAFTLASEIMFLNTGKNNKFLMMKNVA
jgi:hypothetical protein